MIPSNKYNLGGKGFKGSGQALYSTCYLGIPLVTLENLNEDGRIQACDPIHNTKPKTVSFHSSMNINGLWSWKLCVDVQY